MGQTTSGGPTSNYSCSGELIWVKGQQQGKASSQITSNAHRGQQKLTASQPGHFHSGQQVEILLVDDPQKTLLQYLYAGDTWGYEQNKEANSDQHGVSDRFNYRRSANNLLIVLFDSTFGLTGSLKSVIAN